MNMDSHRQWLQDYVEAKIKSTAKDPGPLALKLDHTLRVLANAEAIAKEEGFCAESRTACTLAALYHDLSRFDQYLVYDTFKDRDSRNHGAWSVKLLKNEARLAEEPRSIQRLVLIAVGMHNRLAVPESIQGEERTICNAVRDADKLDILLLMDEHLAQRPYNPTVVLGLPDDPDLSGPKVIESALNERAAVYGDLRSVNDFRLLLGTWLFGMNFKSSRRLFLASGHARTLVSALPANGVYAEAREKLLQLLTV